MFIFILGREFKLSIAEIYSVFPAAHFEFVDEQIALISNIPREEIVERYPRLGGTIKIIEVLGECIDAVDFMNQGAEYLAELPSESKLSFAVASYREKLDNFKVGLRIKKLAKTATSDKSFRLVNKDPKNINSAVYKIEKLSEFETELNSVVIGSTRYIGRTCAYQDVDLYAARDIGKERDMEVGMLPPKLAQTMVNLASPHPQPLSQRARGESDRHRDPELVSGVAISGQDRDEIAASLRSSQWQQGIYDPFCGLGTILIEAANMGYTKLLWSDLAPEMVRATEMNVRRFAEEQGKRNQKQVLAPCPLPLAPSISVFRADAAKLADFTDSQKLKGYSIVTEGYLGEVMSARTVTDDRIASERRKLGRMYDGFFSQLRRLDFSGNIVISFPFWEIRGKYIYLVEGYEAFKRHGFQAQRLLPEDITYQETKTGSLLYKRPGQIVGREVLKLQRAN